MAYLADMSTLLAIVLYPVIVFKLVAMEMPCPLVNNMQ